MDTSILNTLAQIAPDLMDEVELRALILERVAALEPIGRRALAARLHLAEREVRAAAEALKRAGCLTQSASGMELTQQGQNLVETARAISGGRRTLSGIELTLSQRLNVERVCVVRGDADIDSGVMEEVARAAARQIRFLLQDAHVMAVTGGRTVALTAEAISVAAPMEITVVPAQGGVGGGVSTQANTVAERFAQKLGGYYRFLHLPDGLSGAAADEAGASAAGARAAGAGSPCGCISLWRRAGNGAGTEARAECVRAGQARAGGRGRRGTGLLYQRAGARGRRRLVAGDSARGHRQEEPRRCGRRGTRQGGGDSGSLCASSAQAAGRRRRRGTADDGAFAGVRVKKPPQDGKIFVSQRSSLRKSLTISAKNATLGMFDKADCFIGRRFETPCIPRLSPSVHSEDIKPFLSWKPNQLEPS